MALTGLTQEQMESLLEFSLANFSKIGLPTIYDPKITLMEISFGKAMLEHYRNLIYEGTEIYQEYFSDIDSKIIELKKLAMDGGGCYVVPDDEDIEEASDELHEIFKRFCMKNHPDVNPGNEKMFAEMKHKYDSGKYFDFLNECDTNVPGALYLKWLYLQKEIEALKEKLEVKLAIWKSRGFDQEFSDEIDAEWKKKREKISNILALIRKNRGRNK